MATHLTFEEREFPKRVENGRLIEGGDGPTDGPRPQHRLSRLARSTGRRGYRPKQAQRLADERRLVRRRPCKMDDPDVHQYVQDKLRKLWPPDQIAGYVRRDFPRGRRR